jgi:hypothetical protein
MRLLRDRRGVAAVEFAVTAPVLLLLATASFEGYRIHAGGIALETGAAAAARWGALGAEGAVSRNATLREVLLDHVCPPRGAVCHMADTPLPPGDDDVVSALRLQFRAYGDPRNIGQPEPFADQPPENGTWDHGEVFTDLNGDGVWNADMGAANLGGAGDFVVYTVSMAQDVRHPALAAVFGRTLVRTASFTVRNEPF